MYLLDVEIRLAHIGNWVQGMIDYDRHYSVNTKLTKESIKMINYFWNKYERFYGSFEEFEEDLRKAVRNEIRYRCCVSEKRKHKLDGGDV